MEWTRSELKEAGRRAFRPNYWRCVGAVFLMMIAVFILGLCFVFPSIRMVINIRENPATNEAQDWIFVQFGYDCACFFALGALLKIALLNPLEVGFRRFFLKNATGKAELGEILYPLKNGYLNAVKTLFLRDLYIALWAMLFVVPGIVKTYSYLLVPYLLAENPRMATREAFRISRDTMKGQKLNAFFLQLSFIGWNLLAAVTYSLVGIFYAYPYQFSTWVALYQTLCGSASQFDIWITCTSGPLQGSAFPLTESQPVTIGRLPSNQICYPPDYPGISREHARVEWRNGVLTLTDCNSATGTYLDYGERLLPMQPREILPGNGFYLGSPENRFQIRN